MGVQQKTFNIQIKTTNPKVTTETITTLINNAIGDSEFSKDLSFSLKDLSYTYDFMENKIMFSLFLRYTKEEFLEAYTYLTEEEYDLTLAEFNKDKMGNLLRLLQETNQKDLAEPYELSPSEFNYIVGYYVKNNFTPSEQDEFDQILNENHLHI